MKNPSQITDDAFFNGKLKIRQMKNGYRFSVDAVLLANCIHPKEGQTLIDLGTGCGVIALILARRFPGIRIYGVEMQPELAALARQNVTANAMEKQVAILQRDMRDLPAKTVQGQVDWIVSNPPYYKPRSGRINPGAQKALARHEIHLNLSQLVGVVRTLLRTGGRFATIFPADRLIELVTQMQAGGIEPKWIQGVHSHQGENARLVLVHGVKGGRPGLAMAAPLVVYREDRQYTSQVAAMMAS